MGAVTEQDRRHNIILSLLLRSEIMTFFFFFSCRFQLLTYTTRCYTETLTHLRFKCGNRLVNLNQAGFAAQVRLRCQNAGVGNGRESF